MKPLDYALRPSRTTKPTIAQIKAAVAERYGVTVADLEGPCRARPLVIYRHIACYLARQLNGASYPIIGREMGKRDHTTIMYAVRKTKNRIVDDPALDEAIEDLKQDLQTEGRSL